MTTAPPDRRHGVRDLVTAISTALWATVLLAAAGPSPWTVAAVAAVVAVACIDTARRHGVLPSRRWRVTAVPLVRIVRGDGARTRP